MKVHRIGDGINGERLSLNGHDVPLTADQLGDLTASIVSQMGNQHPRILVYLLPVKLNGNGCGRLEFFSVRAVKGYFHRHYLTDEHRLRLHDLLGSLLTIYGSEHHACLLRKRVLPGDHLDVHPVNAVCKHLLTAVAGRLLRRFLRFRLTRQLCWLPRIHCGIARVHLDRTNRNVCVLFLCIRSEDNADLSLYGKQKDQNHTQQLFQS